MSNAIHKKPYYVISFIHFYYSFLDPSVILSTSLSNTFLFYIHPLVSRTSFHNYTKKNTTTVILHVLIFEILRGKRDRKTFSFES